MIRSAFSKLTSLFLSVCLTASVFADTLVDDSFADGESQTQNLAGNSVQLFNGRSANTRTQSVGSVKFDIASSSSEGFWYFFTESGSPVELAVGESLSVDAVFSIGAFVDAGKDIRFGLFDSKGTRNTSDKTGGMNDSTFEDDTAYGARFVPFLAGGEAPITLTKRAPRDQLESAANPFNKSADFPTVSNQGAGVGSAEAVSLVANTDYTLSYSLQRLSSSEMRLEVSVEGGSLGDSYRYSAVDNADLFTSFDCIAYRITGSSFATSITFKRLVVEYVPAPPVITSDPSPSSLTVGVGGEANFTVGASGNGLVYQWKKDGVDIDTIGNPSAATATLTLTGLVKAASGSYTVEVSNGGGSVSSAASALTVSDGPVEAPPVISVQPLSVAAVVGEAVTLSVDATGENLLYQWLKEDAPIAGATAAQFSIASLTVADMGQYSVKVTNGGGSVASNTVELVALSSLSIVDRLPNGDRVWCVDTDFFLEFDEEIFPGASGRIELREASTGAVVDSVDVGAAVRSKSIGGRVMNYHALYIDGAKARISFPLDDAMSYGKSYYLRIEQGAFVDAEGALFAGLSGDSDWLFSVKSSGPSSSARSLVVAADGSGDFQTVQAAIDFVPSGNTQRFAITVKDGIYEELINIPEGKDFITIQGESRNGTILQYPNNNNFNPAGTRHRAAFGMDASNFILQNLTLRNTTSRGGSQAECFRTENDVEKVYVRNVDFFSYQDTILAGGQVYFEDCFVFGDVDFMWGYGGVFFKGCELQTPQRSTAYYTQIRNDASIAGFIYLDCKLTEEDPDTEYDAYAYLSRIDPAAFPYSQVAWINCSMGDHIRPEGWKLDNYSQGTATPNLKFWEYQSTDLSGTPLDVSGRLSNAAQMTQEQATYWSSPLNAIGWNPSAPPMLTRHPAAVTARLGDAATFSVEAVGGATYQWYHDGVAIGGANSSSLTIAATEQADAGDYTVEVTNDEGAITSLGGTLSLAAGLDPYQQYAEALGVDPFSQDGGYWADFDLDGLVNLAEFALGRNLKVADAQGLVGIEAVELEGARSAKITYVRRKQEAEVAVQPRYSHDLRLWRSSPLSSSVVREETTPLDDSFERVELWVALDALEPFFVGLSVQLASAPTLDGLPDLKTLQPGGDAVLSVVATGSGDLTYQWFKDGQLISGASAATLSLAGVDGTAEGRYTVKVESDFGSVTSDPVELQVSSIVDAADFELLGFASLAGGVSGGGVVDLMNPGSNYAVIDSETENPAATLKLLLESATPMVIELQTDIDLGVLRNASRQPLLDPGLIASGIGQINVASNKTLISTTGATLSHGSLRINEAGNVIIRNLKFRGLWEWDEATRGDYDELGWDYIEITGAASKNIWVDHCDFEKAYDGQTDVVRGADLVTISWCRYSGDTEGEVQAQVDALEARYQANAGAPSISYYASLRAGGKSKEQIIADEVGQKKSQLVGNSDDRAYSDAPGGNVKLNLTSHHNWFNKVKDRGPRMRFGNAHVFNNYYHEGSVGANATMAAAVYVENTYFEEIKTPLRYDASQNGKITSVGSFYRKGSSSSSDLSAYHSLAPAEFTFNTPFAFTWPDLTDLPYDYELDAFDFTRENLQRVGVVEPANAKDQARLRQALLSGY